MNTTERMHGGRRGGHLMRYGALTLALGLGLTGCDSLLDVSNPNNVTQEAVVQPQAATAVVNGAAARSALAWAFVVRMATTVSDESTQTGSWDAARDMNNGNLTSPGNADNNEGFNTASVGRWMADEALRLVLIHEEEGTLARRADLMDAYLYAGLSRLLVAEYFEDFVFSNRTEPGAPVGPANMVGVYDEALEFFASMRAEAQAAGDNERVRQAVALTARTHYGKALWQKFQPRGSVPADPLVNSAEANAAATEFFTLSPEPDWRFAHTYGSGSIQNTLANWLNTRREIRPSDRHIIATEGFAVQEVVLRDPVTDIVDPALSARIFENRDGVNWSPLPITSAREMHLILAEAALAGGNTTGFETHINALRALEPSLTPYTGQVAAQDLLIHSREVNLYMTGRRLADQYRFGITSPTWLAGSDAVNRPGSFFPIGEVERQTNCHFLGTC